MMTADQILCDFACRETTTQALPSAGRGANRRCRRQKSRRPDHSRQAPRGATHQTQPENGQRLRRGHARRAALTPLTVGKFAVAVAVPGIIPTRRRAVRRARRSSSTARACGAVTAGSGRA